MNDDQHRLPPAGHDAPDDTTDASGVGPADDSGAPPAQRPKYLFLGILSAIVLLLDVGSKAWAEMALSGRGVPPTVLIPDHLSLALAYNEGGAWGLLQDADAAIRKPFFLVVSVIAIGFIVSLYRRLAPEQWALRWGLPLVLGGALGNLSDRIVRSGVVDFILYRADWVGTMNRLISKAVKSWTVTDFWPTFNVADIAICVGVGLMAVDMMTAKRSSAGHGGSSRAEEGDPESGPVDSSSGGYAPDASDRHELGSMRESDPGRSDRPQDGPTAALLTDR